MTTFRKAPAIFAAARESGSAVLAALAVLAITLVLVGTALNSASHGFRTSHQSSRWAQSAHAAEAGAEIGLMTAQKASWVADGWSGTPGSPGTAAVTKTVPLSTGVPGTGLITTAISVDKIAMGGTEWLRIRSTGNVDIFGGAVVGGDTRDSTLRKLTLRTDRKTGASAGTPRATRTVEILAKPNGRSPFVRALLLEEKITMSGGGTIDSFDSSDPAKSTGGLYDVAKRQSNGDVGINNTMGTSNLNDTFVYGDVAYSGPAIQNTTNVQGVITTPFSQPTDPVLPPTWTTISPTPSIINNTTTLTGGTQAAPVRYKVSALTISGGKVLTLASHAAGQESYLEIWVDGDFTTSGSGYILQEPGVHVTYYIAGNVTASGSSFDNQSGRAENNIVNVITPPIGVSQTVTVSGAGTFVGAVNAPGAALTLSGSANYSGAVIGKSVVISGGASIHYDEALANMSGGPTGTYRVASWVEAVR